MRGLAAIAILLSTTAAAQPVAELDTAVMRIGEHVIITLRMEASTKAVEWPAIPDSIGAHIEVLHVGDLDTVMTDAETASLVRRITITSFDTGYWAIPPFLFRIDGRDAATQPLLLEVRTMTIDESGKLRPLRGIHETPFSLAWYARRYGPWVLAVLALTALIWFLVTRWLLPKPPPLPVPAAEPGLRDRILAELRALEAEELWQAGRHKEYQARLTDLLRGYIEERYDVPALERTTNELMHELAVSPLSHDQRQQLRNMLELADLVKFAKAVPSPAENEAMMSGAERFVMDTAPMAETTPAHAS